MKKYIIIILFLTNLSVIIAQEATFKLASYNLRHDNPKDIGNLWSERRETMTKLISKYDFDIFCTQEAKPNQITDLIDRMPVYSWSGIDKNGNGKDEFVLYSIKKIGSIFWIRDISGCQKHLT